jgi:probable F420-dependent oxidoreductase
MMSRYGLTMPPDLDPHAEIELAQRAERLGYSDVWNGEVSGADGVASIAAAAVSTTTVRLGTGILNVYSRSAFVLAMAAASLQNLSRGRFCLGLGTSSPRIVAEWHGVDFDRPLSRVRDTVAAVRVLLAGERCDLESLRLHGARLTLPPRQPVPIYLAALGPKMLRLAGEISDGVIVNFVAPADITWVVSELAAGRSGSDRPRAEVIARVFLPYPGEDEAAIDTVREVIANYATTPVYRALLQRIGFSRQVRASLQARADKDRSGARRAIDDEMISALAILGPPEAQRSRLAQYVAAGADLPMLTFFHRPLPEQERLALTIEATELFRP